MLLIAFAFGLIAIQVVKSSEDVPHKYVNELSTGEDMAIPRSGLPGTVDAEQIMAISLFNFTEYSSHHAVHTGTQCTDLKNPGGQVIMAISNVSGTLKKIYLVNKDESDLHGRVDYQCNSYQNCSWIISHLNQRDFNRAFIICARSDGYLTYNVFLVVYLEMNKERINNTGMGTAPTTPEWTTADVDQPWTNSTKSPKKTANRLSGGGVVGIVVGLLAALVTIVVGVICFCKNRKSKGKSKAIVV